MTTQTEAHDLIRELEDEAQDNPDDYRWKAAVKMRRLEAANAELLESLVDLVCLYPLDSTDAIITSARAAIAKHGGAA